MKKLLLIGIMGIFLGGCSGSTAQQPVAVETESQSKADTQSLKEQQQELDMLARPYEIDLQLEE